VIKVLLITTGGTIASSQGARGLSPQNGSEQIFEKLLFSLNTKYSIKVLPLFSKDSTNITPDDICRMADTVARNNSLYDAFVITHGTDTLAYTSAGLSCMLQNFHKPLIITGSQLPLDTQDSDGPKNLIDSFTAAAGNIRGCFVVFNGKLISGDRAVKIRTRSFDAFDSPGEPLPGHIKNETLTLADHFKKKISTLKTHKKEMRLCQNTLCKSVFLLKITPALDSAIFDFIAEHYKGVVIEAFGLGGIPERDGITEKIQLLTSRGIPVVIISQCLYEGIDLSVYQVGQKLKESSVINGGVMHAESAVLKLMWALEHKKDLTDLKAFMENV
jgi:L-asparaginase